MNPVIPPRPEVAYVGVTTKPPGGHTSERGRAETPRHREPPPIPPHPVNAEWEAREEMRQRELEEARARATQMEKTMRWWSDCTANWREKWSKVRNERNKSRDECRQLRAKLESSVKECSTLKREKQELATEIESLRKQLELSVNEKEQASVVSSAGSQKSGSEPDNQVTEAYMERDNDTASCSVANNDLNFVDRLLSKKHEKDKDKSKPDSDTSSSYSEKGDRSKSSRRRTGDDGQTPEEQAAQQKVSMLQLKLDEAQKTIQAEREEKSTLAHSIEKLQADLESLRVKYDDVKLAKQDVSDQLGKLQGEHQEMVGRISMELEDESHSRSSLDRRLADLRTELERLQAENAAEWGKRERLESEKLSLERENKKLRTEVDNLEEELEKKGRQASAILDTDLKALQHDLLERTKELGELKHSHSKVKKHLQEKTTELEHAQRRAEQYETEVKKLRARIEDLKRELANAEDEIDQQANQLRKLQRTNDELQETSENLQVQVEHLQTRLRRSGQSLIGTRASSLKSYDPESTDNPTTDEDAED